MIGEVIGGIFLGPSVFGRLAPETAPTLFLQSSMASFETLSTVGLIVFLFLIGIEVDLVHLYQQRAAAALSSLMSIVLPFALGALLTPSLRERFGVL